MSVSNSLTKREDKPKTFSAYLSQDSIKRKINEMVGGVKGQQFITSIISAVSTNPTLAECDNASIVSAALLGQALGLSPSPQLGQYYLVPYNKKIKNPDGSSYTIKVAQFQLGYKGYIQLAIRTGKYKKINVLAIKEGELIKYDPLTEEIKVNLIEDDDIREQTPTIGYFAMFELINGFTKTLYFTKKKMLNHANTYSQAFNKEDYQRLLDGKIAEKDMWKYSFWYKNFDEMALKTMLRKLIGKYGVMSIEFEKAYEEDMAEVKEDGSYEYVDNNQDIEVIENQSVEEIKENTTSNQDEIKTNWSPSEDLEGSPQQGSIL